MTRVTVLDGGMGRELKRIGAPFRQPEWSALALIESPEHVRRAHEAFARAGADVITTNAYAVVPFHIGAGLFESDGRGLAVLGSEVARSVADEFGLRVAGSLPPVLGSYRPDRFVADPALPILEVLVEAQAPYVDVWQEYHSIAGKIDDFHRLAHIEHEEVAALGQRAGHQNQTGRLGDGHEIAGDVGVGHRDRAAVGSLRLE